MALSLQPQPTNSDYNRNTQVQVPQTHTLDSPWGVLWWPRDAEQDNPVSGCVWRRIKRYAAGPVNDDQIFNAVCPQTFGSIALRGTKLSELTSLFLNQQHGLNYTKDSETEFDASIHSKTSLTPLAFTWMFDLHCAEFDTSICVQPFSNLLIKCWSHQFLNSSARMYRTSLNISFDFKLPLPQFQGHLSLSIMWRWLRSC